MQVRRLSARRRAAETFGAATFAVYAALLLIHRSAPSLTDYANWVYQGVLLHGHLVGLPDTAHRLKVYPVPNSAATLGVGLLCLLLPWKWAADVWLCLQLAASWAVTRHLMRTVEASNWLWAIVPTVTYLNVNFWYGFMNFQLGLCWVVLMASLLIREKGKEQSGCTWPIAPLLVVCFFTHMIPFAFCGLLVILFGCQTKQWRTLWALLPGGALALWYVAGRFLLEHDADGQAGMVATVKTYSGAFWAYKVGSYLKSFGYVNPSGATPEVFGRAGMYALLVLNLLLGGLLGWGMAQTAWAAMRNRSPECFVWVGVLVTVPIYLLLPGAAFGVSDPGARLLQTGLALAVVFCGRERSNALRFAAAGAGILGLAGMILFVREGFASTPNAQKVQLPYRVKSFNHVPSHDQDIFYEALREGQTDVPVFPTGMFLNKIKPRPDTR